MSLCRVALSTLAVADDLQRARRLMGVGLACCLLSGGATTRVEAQRGVLLGRVVQVADPEQPLSGQLLVLRPGRVDVEAGTVIGPDGRFHVELDTGEVDVYVAVAQYAPYVQRVRIAANDTAYLAVQMSPVAVETMRTRFQFKFVNLWWSQHFNLSEPNFFLFGTGPWNQDPTRSPETYLNQIKFRVAIRYYLLHMGNVHDSGILVGYRQNSFWHIGAESGPFFDNNYNPQAMAYFDGRDRQRQLFRRSLSWLVLVEHESNGRDGPQSRSWNRAGVGLDWGDVDSSRVFVNVRGWHPFKVASENPDLPAWAGRGELTVNIQPGIKNRTPLRLGALGMSARLRVGGVHAIVNGEFNVYVSPVLLSANKMNRGPLSLMLQGFCGTGEALLVYRERRCVMRAGFATVN